MKDKNYLKIFKGYIFSFLEFYHEVWFFLNAYILGSPKVGTSHKTECDGKELPKGPRFWCLMLFSAEWRKGFLVGKAISGTRIRKPRKWGDKTQDIIRSEKENHFKNRD
jgi:hypothetical protein